MYTLLSGDTIIPLLDGTKQTIKSLYEQNKNDFYVNSFDVKSNRFVPGRCLGVTKTGENREVFKITFDDGTYVRLTENHLVLLSDNSYCRVENLKTNDSVKTINIERSSRITSIQSDGFTDVYDLEVETFHNFAITGDESFTSYVMVHNCAQDEKGQQIFQLL
jgi:intein/homing endonuclease